MSERRKLIIPEFLGGLGFAWVLGEFGFDITVRGIMELAQGFGLGCWRVLEGIAGFCRFCRYWGLAIGELERFYIG